MLSLKNYLSFSIFRENNSFDAFNYRNGRTYRKHIMDYCAETSLHGPKYITEDGNHPLER